MQDAQEQGDVKATQYAQSMVQLTRIKMRLDRAIGKFTGHSNVTP
jgi:hypothetical protein